MKRVNSNGADQIVDVQAGLHLFVSPGKHGRHIGIMTPLSSALSQF